MGQAPAGMGVIVVSYNTAGHLRACLESLLPEGPAELLVLDNGSSDGSAAMVRAEFPQVRLLARERNDGFGAACNEAARHCARPHLLLLNSDTRVLPGAIAALEAAMAEYPRAGIVGPRLLNPDGSLQPSCFPFPTPLNSFLELSNLGGAIARAPLLRERYLRTWAHDRPRAVPWVLGAALAVRRAAFEAVGGFDESYFMYSEEVDLSWRMLRAGWETRFVPTAEVAHVGGASANAARSAMTVQLFQSKLAFYRRHYAPPARARLWLVLMGGALAKLARDALRLGYVRDPLARARLAEDVRIWRAVLGSLGRPARMPEGRGAR